MKNSVWAFLFLGVCLMYTSGLSASNIPLDPFDELTVTGNIEVELVKAAEESMEVEDDFSKLRFEVINGILRIKRRKLYSIREYEDPPIRIRLNYKDIRSVKAVAGAFVSTGEQALESNILRLRFGSGARGKLTLKVEELSINMTEGAQLKLRGEAVSQETAVTTGAILDAHRLDSRRASVRAGTGGEVEVSVSEYIYANANTGGDIEYHGEPERVRIKDSLGGDVSPKFYSKGKRKRTKL
ncbi:MAG: head GIN domain-containing protein [Bacteroidota bacterium]